MDLSLFGKYAQQLVAQKTKKEEVILLIKEVSQIELLEEEFSLKEEEITLMVSSVILSRLKQPKVTSFLKEHGYIVK